MGIDATLVKKTKTWLRSEGVDLFKEWKVKYGTVSPVIDGVIPHAVHFWEGMQVRNFLREQDECKDWTDEDFDDTWIEVIENTIL